MSRCGFGVLCQIWLILVLVQLAVTYDILGKSSILNPLKRLTFSNDKSTTVSSVVGDPPQTGILLSICYDDVIDIDPNGNPIRIDLFNDSPFTIASTVIKVFSKSVPRIRTLVKQAFNDTVNLPQQLLKSAMNLENQMELTVMESIEDLKRLVRSCLNANQTDQGRYGWTPLALMDNSQVNQLRGFRLNPLSKTRKRRNSECPMPPEEEMANLPEEWDWRAQGVVTPIREQSCPDCTVFATIAAVESAILRGAANTSNVTTKNLSILVDLSEQMLDQCIDGCRGGNFDGPYQWLVKHGAVEEKVAPYDADDDETECKGPFPISISSYCEWDYTTSGGLTDQALQWIVWTHGPTSIGIDSSSADIRFVRGRYTATGACDSNVQIDHAVLLVGWTKTNWIIKNSWGVKWGDHGFFTMPRRNNLCGINNIAAVPIL